MKNWLTQVVAGLFAVATLASCEKDEEKATITPSNAITLSTSTSAAVLVQANAEQTAATYTWTPVTKFTMSGAGKMAAPTPSYQIQFSKSEKIFGYPAKIAAGTGSTKSITVAELNEALLIGLGLTPGVPVTVYARVAAVIGTDEQTFVSKPVALTVTPYKVCLAPNTDSWGLVGPAGNGWPGPTDTDIPLVWDCDAKAYVLTTTLNVGDFKFRLNKKWDTNLGALIKPITPGATTIELKPGGEDMTVKTAGVYTIKLEVTGSGAGTTAAKLTVTP